MALRRVTNSVAAASILLLAAFLVLAGCTAASAASRLPLEQVVDIPLPGRSTRLDYQGLDVRRNVLFIAHLGDGQITVVDTRSWRVIGVIPHVAAVHGVLVIPERNTVYASATGKNEVVAIDEATLAIKARMPGGVYPDGMAYDPRNKRLFVSDEHGATETVIDVARNKRIATIPLGGEVGNSQYDSPSGHVFVNVQTLGQLVEIDPRTDRIVHRFPVPGCSGNHGLLIDEVRRRAFIACEDNAKLVWFDLRTRGVREIWSIGTAPDVLALDSQTQRLYIAAESGTVSVFENGANVSFIAQAYLAPAAHAVAVDPVTHFVYFPLENIGGRPVLRVMRQK